MNPDPRPAATDGETAALIALAGLEGIGPATLLDIHRSDGAEAGLDAIATGRFDRVRALAERLPPGDRRRRLVRQARTLEPASLLTAQRAHGRHVLVADRAGYPSILDDDPAPPAILFAEGDVRLLGTRAVAIVGTRNTTRIGREISARLGEELGARGIGVVSGLALGIDAAAHDGVLAHLDAPRHPDRSTASGRPIAVIASGLDISYPRRHTALQRRVVDTGVVVSEVPLGLRPARWRFPARNRLIAALSAGVVVVESRLTGGSMSTVEEAAARGLEVMAVPGHPLAPASAGTNQLIFDGAGLVRDVADICSALGWDLPPLPTADEERTGEPGGPDAVEGVERLVLDQLLDGPASMAELVDRMDTPMAEIAAALIRLEVDRFVVGDNGWFELAGRGLGRSEPV